MFLNACSLRITTLLAMLSIAACVAPPPAPQMPTDEASKAEFCAYDEVIAAEVAKVEAKRPKHNVLGWVEWGKVKGTGHVVKAKLDSGAKTTSINAEVVREFEKDGKEYLLYHVKLSDDAEADHATFESPITRWVKIRTKRGNHIRRPVVEMEICVGGIPMKGEVNLANRDHFNYPILIGRNMLQKKNIIVDSGNSFLAERECD